MDLRYIDEPDPNLHYSEKLDYGSTLKSKFRGCRGAKWSHEGLWTLTNGDVEGLKTSGRRFASHLSDMDP
jgi:hypothetical protein